jgi:hypothetical protein
LRPDVVLDDLVMVLMANDGIQAPSPAARIAASRRFAALVVQAFRTAPTPSAAAGRAAVTDRAAQRRGDLNRTGTGQLLVGG